MSAIRLAQLALLGSIWCRSMAGVPIETQPGDQSSVGISQQDLDNIARDVYITTEVIDNLKNSNRTYFSHGVRIYLHNRGDVLVPSSGWLLFFHNLFLLFPAVFPKAKSTILDVEKLRITMYGGTLYSMEPVAGFRAIEPDEIRVIELDSSFWSVAETDFMPYWYFVSSKEGLKPRIVRSTEDMSLRFVKPFKDVRQWKRYRHDKYNPFTPQERMRRLQVNDTGRIEKPVIPTPLYMNIRRKGKTVTVGPTWKIYHDAFSKNAADYLADKLSLPESLTTVFPTRNKAIYLHVGPLKIGPEGYGLRIDPRTKVIEIMSEDDAGIFYGVQTLLSLIQTFPEGLPHTDVHDKPRFEYRGMMVDTSRHFVPSHELKRLMDIMAVYKLNKLHLHLANDEGIRLHVPDLPELTDVGADRCHDLTEQNCIISQLGTGPFEIVRRGRYGWSHEFYKTPDYKALLEYANALHIEVIPEFDMPAHSHAAIKAMEARYNEYRMTNLTKAEEFRLIDPEDTSEYITLQWWYDNVMNPCIESTYRFVAKVVDTLIALHEGIQPLKTFHFGGDEAPKGAWENSTRCKKFMTENPGYNSVADLKRYFVERVAKITAERGLGLRGWADGLLYKGNKTGEPFSLAKLANKDLTAYDWHDIWEWGPSPAYRLANAGYKVILPFASHLYFDQPQEPDPEERGLYWASRYTDTRKTFGFMPDSIYDNIDIKRSGEPLTKLEVCGRKMAKCEPLVRQENIKGIQGQLWTETVRTYKEFEHMVYPRLLALAERAWHKAPFEASGLTMPQRKRLEHREWEMFANTLGHKELKRLDEAFGDIKDGVFYRVPPPGGRVVNGKVEVSVTFPGLVVEYSRDGGVTWNEFTSGYDVYWEKDQKVMHLRTRSAIGGRYSRVVELYEEEPKSWTDQNTIDYIAKYLKITVGVVDNVNKIQDRYVTLVLKLHNVGKDLIPIGTWKIYFHNLYGLVEEELDCGLFLDHVNGDLYSLTFVNDPHPGNGVTCTLHQESWNVAKSDFFPNWYVSSTGMVPKVIENTRETLDYVLPYDSPEKWKRTKEDQYNPITPEATVDIHGAVLDCDLWTRRGINFCYCTSHNFIERYDMYKSAPLKTRKINRVVPKPFLQKDDDESRDIRLDDWVILRSSEFEKEAHFLADKMKLPLRTFTAQKAISFTNASWPGLSSEAYQLFIRPTNIIITAQGSSGAFYAVQSLLSLWEAGKGEVPVMDIRDKPRFGFRGVMIDVARNFKPKTWIFKIMDIMALYKLNILHLHLTDDEGWRLEIPGIPELTEMGVNRCQNHDRDLCLIPQRGSGPDKSLPGSGFYTVQDYRDILQYAADRHIIVIPEIDMPGHSRAAIVSMEYRKSKIENLRSRGADVSQMKSYHLLDPLDRPVVESIHGWMGNMMNPCIPTTYEFINKVIDELVLMHHGIMDMKVFNMGGNNKIPEGEWINSPACQSHYHTVETLALRKNFVNMVADIVAAKQMDLMAWEDEFYDVDKPIPISEFRERNLYVITWDNKWEDGKAKRTAQFADAGYKVILAPDTHLFLDAPLEPDPVEPGWYWATRYTDQRKIFGFMPDDFYLNAEVTAMGTPVNATELCRDNGCPQTNKPHNIIGMEGVMFSDIIRTEAEMHAALFPRLLAMAERAWYKAPWEHVKDKEKRQKRREMAWEMFNLAVKYNERPRLEKRNIRIMIPPPGARIIGNLLQVVPLSTNFHVELSLDDGLTWSNVYSHVFLRPGKRKILLQSRCKMFRRTSRIIILEREIKRPRGYYQNQEAMKLQDLIKAKLKQSGPGSGYYNPIFQWWRPSS